MNAKKCARCDKRRKCEHIENIKTGNVFWLCLDCEQRGAEEGATYVSAEAVKGVKVGGGW